jgi:N-acetylmuramoyl-L-alanine amidase
MGYRVYLTRNSDRFIPLKKRTHYANLKKADLFISIHCNIAPKHNQKIHGIETYFLSPSRNERAIRVARLENKEIKGLNYLDQRVILNFLNRDRMIDSNKLAIDIQKGMLSSLRSKFNYVKDNGVRPAPFWVLVGTQMPAILIETGYLTNPVESARLFKPSYQKRLARGIAEGIQNYFRKNP